MGKFIQVQDVPEDIHRTLKARAARLGISLSDYLRAEFGLIPTGHDHPPNARRCRLSVVGSAPGMALASESDLR